MCSFILRRKKCTGLALTCQFVEPTTVAIWNALTRWTKASQTRSAGCVSAESAGPERPGMVLASVVFCTVCPKILQLCKPAVAPAVLEVGLTPSFEVKKKKCAMSGASYRWTVVVKSVGCTLRFTGAKQIPDLRSSTQVVSPAANMPVWCFNKLPACVAR